MKSIRGRSHHEDTESADESAKVTHLHWAAKWRSEPVSHWLVSAFVHSKTRVDSRTNPATEITRRKQEPFLGRRGQEWRWDLCGAHIGRKQHLWVTLRDFCFSTNEAGSTVHEQLSESVLWEIIAGDWLAVFKLARTQVVVHPMQSAASQKEKDAAEPHHWKEEGRDRVSVAPTLRGQWICTQYQNQAILRLHRNIGFLCTCYSQSLLPSQLYIHLPWHDSDPSQTFPWLLL